jgi:hypothetical protein
MAIIARSEVAFLNDDYLSFRFDFALINPSENLAR